ncbi:DUF1853 family protein [Flavobacteriaceae bacterium]|jgi:hypothetical protein|nr:DUF1853 family protein [Flavobacteriaceae bacterium]
MNTTQQRFEGFLNTPILWKDSEVCSLTQFKIEQELLSFNEVIDSNQRLGKYVERLVSFQLSQDKSIEIVSENIQISKNKITLGELDCIILKDGKPIHLEIIYKFYLYDAIIGESSLQHWIGPNRKDSLIEKLDKLQQKQLPLLYSKECQEYLRNIDLKSSDISQQVYFKAQLFVPLNTKINHGEVNPACIVGYYIYRNELSLFKESKFYIPNKKDWLILPHTNVDWLNYDDFFIESKEYLDREFSPMCWIKSKNGELKKFFLVWWPPEVV